MENALYQLKTCGKPLDGMSYVITCDDGSVLVIDGSYDKEDADLLLTWLKKITGEEKPTVTAWFLTHAHPDHTFALKGMGERHNEEVTVKSVVYAFPDADTFLALDPRVLPEIQLMEAAIDRFEGCVRVTPKRGEVYTYGSVQIKILMTYVDLFAKERADKISVNDTSTAFWVMIEGQKILFPGDLQRAGDEAIIELYGQDLKSDVVQMAHHGCSHGSTYEFYQLVDPSILLWPANEKNFEWFLKTVSVDQKLLGTGRVKDVIPAAHGSRKIPLPIKVGEAPFVPDVAPTIREAKADISAQRADVSANPWDLDDACWNKATILPLAFEADVKGDMDYSAHTQLLWTPGELYVKTRIEKPPVPNPKADSSHLCDNLRVYFSQYPVLDLWEQWYTLPKDMGFGDLKIYPEVKEKYASNLSRNDVAEAKILQDDKGWTALVRLPFKEAKKAGDLLGLNVEANGFDPSLGVRPRVKSLVELKTAHQCVFYPGQLAFVELV